MLIGFPYPENLSLAVSLEAIVRQNGAVPATIGVLDGHARVGFSSKELAKLIEASRTNEIFKLSRRDLAFACASVKLSYLVKKCRLMSHSHHVVVQ